MYEAEADTKRLIDYARQLEGVTRHASVHAAGVVIAPSTVTDYTPVQREPNGGEKLVTQYDMLDVGEDGVGLLKMDFLGLRNLTIIEESIRFIRENRGVEINSSRIPYDDAKAYELLASGETTGIFQFESAGMRRYIKELKPTNIFDVSAMVALYRPGPMANIPEYIARKRDSTKIHYFDERLHDVHRQSLGMLVYQDDVLLMAITLAGYTWLDADKFRKAMGKKIPEEMKKQEEKFISGAQAYGGLSPQRAKELYALVAPFAGYGFNKAHAACYATIAYRTAYLKANYPVEFMTALLTAESRGTTGPQKDEKIAQVIAECKRLQLQLYPPDINTSQEAFTIENGSAIRFGLSAIKNIGDAAIADILAERKTSPFTSLDDFAIRMIGTAVNKKTIESLIKAGAMDRFGNRAAILTSYPETMEKVAKLKKQRSEGQTSLFGDEAESQDTYTASPQVTDIEDFTISQKLAFEKELLGIYLSAHPQDAYIDIIRAAVSHELESLEDQQAGAHVTVGGYIASVRKIFTKKSNAEMAFIRIENHRGTSVECVVFPKVYEQYKDLIAVDGIVLVSGKLDSKNDQQVILADAIRLPHTRPAL
jgi:DNA polymerase-3 subunit alpha